MEKPSKKPHYPYFSSGPCAKPPGWSFQKLSDAALSRSHRSAAAVQKLQEVIDKSRQVLEIPFNDLNKISKYKKKIKGIIVSSPNNPTGKILKEEELKLSLIHI